MATIKSFTSLEQSKVLSEILPPESADMHILIHEDLSKSDYGFSKETQDFYNKTKFEYLPCWSLAALLGILPNNKYIATTLSKGVWKIEPVEYIDKWFCEYENRVEEDIPCKDFSVSADNPVDACVAMVEKLHELNLL